MVLDTIVYISQTNEKEAIVQTNILTKSDKIQNISNCQIELSQDDCIELAIALSYIHTYTEYENEDYWIQRFVDGEIVKEYKNQL